MAGLHEGCSSGDLAGQSIDDDAALKGRGYRWDGASAVWCRFSTKDGPADGLQILSQALFNRALVVESSGRTAATARRPIPIYRLDVSALDCFKALSGVKQVGWRYLVRQADQDTAVDLVDVAGRLLFHAAHRGARAKRLEDACDLASKAADPNMDYDVRILGIPELHLQALWLSSPEDQRFTQISGLDGPKPMDFLAEARAMVGRRKSLPQGDPKDLGG